MKSIFFIMPNLGGGGGERVISILLNNVNRSLFKPHLIILKKKGSNAFEKDLKKDIPIYYFNIKNRIRISFLWTAFKLFKFCRNNNVDVLFFGSGQINAIMSPFIPFLSKKIKLIARESNIPSKFERALLPKLLYRYTYRNYDCIITQSNDMYKDLNSNFKIPVSKLVKINNPVDFGYVRDKLSNQSSVLLDKNKINLLAVGRLTYQKGFDLLIKELRNVDLDFKLNILGDGEDFDDLLRMVDAFGLSDRVSFLGNVDNPYEYMEKSDFLVLSSRFEGFPNVLLESLSCGTPILSNNCLGGIDEIIVPKFNGVIFDFDKEDFDEKLNEILKIKFDRKKIIVDTETRFSVDKKITEYQKLF